MDSTTTLISDLISHSTLYTILIGNCCIDRMIRRTSNSVFRAGLRDWKFMVGNVQWFYIPAYGKNTP